MKKLKGRLHPPTVLEREQESGVYTCKPWAKKHLGLRFNKEKVMAQFAALLRKDNQPVRYLVVDDSVFARKNIIKMVQLFGGEIAGEAGDGLTAIAEYGRTKPDVVLMDITMPQMEGIEAVERIVRQHPEARIVMVSSVGYQENILAALQKGAKHFVQKPVKPEVLYEILRYVLSDDPALAGSPVALAGEHRS
jgi:two-component system chemotaxis response regulator CheY